MPMYKKKPVAVECYQLEENNVEQLSYWSHAEILRRPNGEPSGMMVMTLEGNMTGKMGDYLIKGVRGEFYFCDKDIFEETYEEINNDNGKA